MRLTADDLTPLRETIRMAAEQHGKTMGQVCLQWVCSKGVIPLVGTRTVEQLEDSLGALDFSLTQDEIALLDEAALGSSTFERPMWRRALFMGFLSLLVAGVKVSRSIPSERR